MTRLNIRSKLAIVLSLCVVGWASVLTPIYYSVA